MPLTTLPDLARQHVPRACGLALASLYACSAHATASPLPTGSIGPAWAEVLLSAMALVAVVIAYVFTIASAHDGEEHRPQGTLDEMLLRYVKPPRDRPQAGASQAPDRFTHLKSHRRAHRVD